MRRTTALAALLLSSAAAALPVDRLDRLVGDRVAGAAVARIDRLDIDTVALVPGGIVYTMKTGGVVYLNRPTAGAGFIHGGVVLAIDDAYPRLCRDEPVRVLNENSRAAVATATLGDFIPYRRP